MGFDFLPHIYLIFSLLLASFSAFFPNYFPGCYLFLFTFLMMKGEKVNLTLFSISAYRVFLLVFLSIFFIRYLRNIKNILKILKKSHLFLIGGLFASIAFPSLFHYFWWKNIPLDYLVVYTKALFPLVFLLVPQSEWDFKKINHSLIFYCLAVLLLTTIPSIDFFLEYGRSFPLSFYRIRQFSDIELTYTQYFILNNKTIPILHLTDSITILWSILAAPLFFSILNLLMEKRKTISRLAWIPMIYVAGMIYINHMLKMVIAEVITVLSFAAHLILQKKRPIKHALIQLFIYIILILTFTLTHNFQNLKGKFVHHNIDITRKANNYSTRFDVLRYTFLKTWNDSPIKGFGYPVSESTLLPSGAAAGEQATNHMEGVDMLFYFGFILGWIASYLYLVPILFVLIKFKNWVKSDTNQAMQLLAISTLTLLFRFVAELGRGVEVNSIFVYLLVLLIMYDNKVEANEQFKK